MKRYLDWYLLLGAVLTLIFLGVQMSTLSLEPKKNIELVRTIANKVFVDKPVVAELCLAQAILESGLQGTPSKLAFKYNNLFGIKGDGTRGRIVLSTSEQDDDGNESNIMAGFAFNASIEDSINQYKHLLENGTSDNHQRYQKVLNAKTFEEAAVAIRQAGYATDISYTKQLLNIYERVIKK